MSNISGVAFMEFEKAAGPDLDRWVAIAEGLRVEKRFVFEKRREEMFVVDRNDLRPVPPYSTDAGLAAIIIERECIETSWVMDGEWDPPEQAIAWIDRPTGPNGEPAVKTGRWMAESEIAAAMMCYVFSKLGDVWVRG